MNAIDPLAQGKIEALISHLRRLEEMLLEKLADLEQRILSLEEDRHAD